MTRRPRAATLFAASIGMLVVFAVAGFAAGTASLDSLAEDRARLVDRIDPSLVSAQRFLIAMIDEETGVRGYSLAGDKSFLAPYDKGMAAAPAELATLQRLTRRRRETEDVAAAAQAWQTRFAAPTIAAVAADRALPPAHEGKRLFDALRVRVGALTRALDTERAHARTELRAAARRVRLVVIVFTAVVFIAVVASALLLQAAIVRPLLRLAARVRNVVGGNFGARVEAGGAREVAALGHDIDAMRERIVAERDDLKRSNAELEQFAYVASHDLQEPLRKVASFTQMLQRRYGGQLDERADTYIEFAVDGAKRMQELINDLLAFSRVGRITEAFVEVDANELVSHAVRDLDTSEGSVEVGELPVVRGEPRLLELVFANLLSNAFKFRSDDPPLVRIHADRGDGEWCFTVADNGIGIEPEYADRIFVIFQRLHTRSAYQGTGIGLAMCRKIIEYHGGRIWLDTEAAAGTTFQFTLPEVT